MDLTDFQTDKKIKGRIIMRKHIKKVMTGKLFGIPAGINPKLIDYNANLLKEMGIEDSNEIYKEGTWNLDHLINICKQFKENKKIYGMAIKDDWATIFSMINNNDGKFKRL